MSTVPKASEALPISAVAEILFCPRNFYYRMVEQVQDDNEHTVEGKLQDERRSTRRTQVRPGLIQTREIHVACDRLGLVGVVDVVEDSGEVTPIEYKKGPLRESANDDVQLCAQAMALEEMMGCEITHGYIYYAASHSRRIVWFRPELRDLTEQTVAEARRILEEGVIPPPVNDSRCDGCALKCHGRS